MVPAWDVRPGMEVVRRVEEGPLVVSVPVRKRGEGRGVGGTGHGGDVGDGDGGGQGGGGGGEEEKGEGRMEGRRVVVVRRVMVVKGVEGGKALDPYGKPIARESENGFRPTRGGAKTRPGAGRGGAKTRGGGALAVARRMPTPFPGPDDGPIDVDAEDEDGYNNVLQYDGGGLGGEARPGQDLSEFYKRKFEEQKRQNEALRDSHEQFRLRVEQLERAK